MRVLLLNPSSPFLIDDKVFPPLGIGYIYAALIKADIDVSFLDLAGGGSCEIDYSSYDIVGITMTTPQIAEAKLIAKHIMSTDKPPVVVAGGCGVMSLDDGSAFDVIFKGEGEIGFIDMINSTISKGECDGGMISDIDSVPYPERSIFKDYKYEIDGHSTATMLTSRGCSFGCAFCTDGASKTVRRRSVDNIIGEIDDVRSRGYTGVMFFDDVFTINRDRVRVIGDYLMSKDMVYRCFTHVRVASKVAKTLADTDCKEVGIGIESGDDDILRTIRKNYHVAEARDAIRILKAHGVRVKTFFMVGLPGETKDTIQSTRRFIAETKPDDIDVSVYVPFPGTDIYDNRANYDISWNGSNMNNFYKGKPGSYKVNTWTSKLTSEEILEARDSIEKEFKQWL